ncbi:NUDIX hydrolase [Pseudoteredinibacter isoporae]|uniref:ADP-ribose pyrophosphatase YjhB (NUDIX family) n=1 Tax=Pseudoteredinibacter isoporae TaxID=570281 RepID=A0A7X0JWJ5_9GAMM|nr:NUDIX hydrolase [Pseudoteredinibacter isoporae]MBB6523139.1 ADP-ribose pyrophosphatase YjhB (NUDIX family) [Pseudoteredinibacter isoporae]NHO88658.1 NUDIX hydrolase [Pseudoteredinibacter isoporae]NIB22651.1 NUDIX hydrolase [Pseudoteredinibacter isoporae]
MNRYTAFSRIFILLGSCVSLSACDLLNSPTTGSGQANAGCLLEHKASGGEYRILMVQQHNGEWNFPGGGFRWRETPAQTAERETFEETGVAVDAIEMIKTFDNGFQLFSCKSKDGTRPNPEDNIEILSARWVNPTLIPAVQWRFSYQRAWLMDYLNQSKANQTEP